MLVIVGLLHWAVSSHLLSNPPLQVIQVGLKGKDAGKVRVFNFGTQDTSHLRLLLSQIADVVNLLTISFAGRSK